MSLQTYIGTHQIINQLSRYTPLQDVTLSITVVCPYYRSRRTYRGFLRLLDHQPALTYTTQSSGSWWHRYRQHLIIVHGTNSALQAAIHQLEARYSKKGGGYR